MLEEESHVTETSISISLRLTRSSLLHTHLALKGGILAVPEVLGQAGSELLGVTNGEAPAAGAPGDGASGLGVLDQAEQQDGESELQCAEDEAKRGAY